MTPDGVIKGDGEAISTAGVGDGGGPAGGDGSGQPGAFRRAEGEVFPAKRVVQFGELDASLIV